MNYFKNNINSFKKNYIFTIFVVILFKVVIKILFGLFQFINDNSDEYLISRKYFGLPL